MRCSHCGGNIISDNYGDSVCLQCGRPVITENDRKAVTTIKETRVELGYSRSYSGGLLYGHGCNDCASCFICKRKDCNKNHGAATYQQRRRIPQVAIKFQEVALRGIENISTERVYASAINGYSAVLSKICV